LVIAESQTQIRLTFWMSLECHTLLARKFLTATLLLLVVASVLNDFAPQVLVVSPGVRPDSPIIGWALELGVAVWVDIELAWRLRDKTEKTADWLWSREPMARPQPPNWRYVARAGFSLLPVATFGSPMLDLVRRPTRL
jgi:UDP-N-acetylmuramoylalanine--D-glutamate ligase